MTTGEPGPSQVGFDQLENTKVADPTDQNVEIQGAALDGESTDADTRSEVSDLDEVVSEALNSLKKSDIVLLKSMPKPPHLVAVVMNAVCILLNLTPEWKTSKKILNDPQFLKKLQAYDKDNISPSVLRKLRPYLEDPNFQPDIVGKVSTAAKPLCMWVRAMGYEH